MKLTVIGGGGVRSIFLAKSIALEAKALGIDHLVFMDNNPQKLEIFGKLAQGAVQKLEPSLNFSLTTDATEAIRDADYVITTIRVGGDSARVADEKIALSLGLLAQETTGACGFSFAMRSIPVLVKYCELIKKFAKPSVKVFNFTNPAGLVSQALRDMDFDFTFGICDAPTSLMAQIATMKGVSSNRIETTCYGLNHLSWFPSVKLDGKDITQELIADEQLYHKTDMKFFESDLVASYGMLFNEYLYYYFYREKAVANIQNAGLTRGQQIASINQQMIRDYLDNPQRSFEENLAVFEHYFAIRENAYMAAETGKHRENEYHFDLFGPDTGGYAGVALNYIRIQNQGEPGRMILSIPNQGALSFLHNDDVAELSCLVDRNGVQPDSFGTVHPVAREMILRMKLYERWAAEAILKKDFELAVYALQLHPLIESFSLAKQLATRYFELNEPWMSGYSQETGAL